MYYIFHIIYYIEIRLFTSTNIFFTSSHFDSSNLSTFLNNLNQFFEQVPRISRCHRWRLSIEPCRISLQRLALLTAIASGRLILSASAKADATMPSAAGA